MKVKVLLWTETDDTVIIDNVHSWYVDDGVLVLSKKIDKDEYKTIASFAADSWAYIKAEND